MTDALVQVHDAQVNSRDDPFTNASYGATIALKQGIEVRMMDNEKEREEGFAAERDSLEGQYPQHGNTRPRTVHGQYTETEEDAPDAHVEGKYTGASEHGEEPEVSSTEKRHGNYPKSQR